MNFLSNILFHFVKFDFERKGLKIESIHMVLVASVTVHHNQTLKYGWSHSRTKCVTFETETKLETSEGDVNFENDIRHI